MSGLDISGLSVRYGTSRDGFQALDEINLSICRGKFVTLLGPSGSGKTTLLRCIAGLVTPTSGRITAGDRLFYDASTGMGLPSRHRNLGMVFQAFALWPHMTVAENIAFPLRQRGWTRAKYNTRVDELLKLVGLPGLGSRYPAQLSGGQQQRVGLARAISCEPSLLLMDEPLSSLDAKLREEMRSYIRRLQTELGITVIYVTHDRDEALGLSDEIVILSAGRQVARGFPRELFRKPPDAFTATFLAGWSLVGPLDALMASPDGRWLAHVERGSPCRCGGHCAAVLPIELPQAPTRGAPCSEETVPGEVMNVEFLGASLRVELKLPGVDKPVFLSQADKSGEGPLELGRGDRLNIPLNAFQVLCARDDNQRPQNSERSDG